MTEKELIAEISKTLNDLKDKANKMDEPDKPLLLNAEFGLLADGLPVFRWQKRNASCTWNDIRNLRTLCVRVGQTLKSRRKRVV